MKLLILLAAAFAVGLAQDGIPIAKCPPGEHSVLYCPQKAEPSCDNPTIHALDGPAACGIPDCFCNTPTIRDLKTGKCVKRQDCSQRSATRL